MSSTYKRDGTREYTSKTLENNWYEERERMAAGERVSLKLMEGAIVRPEEPDISIAPPTRVPGAKSNGRLELATRYTRSIITNDSSRQGADDGYREYLSMNNTFYLPISERNDCPISHEANYHGTWGGPIQTDGRTKTRVGPFNRSKNAQFEENRIFDSEKTVAKKMISADTFEAAMVPRVQLGTLQPGGGFGSILPRHSESSNERMLTTTAMASWGRGGF
jgi:hypothetical protein